MNRRDFVKLTAMAGAATLLPWRRAYAAFKQSLVLKKFCEPLQGLGPTGIPVALPDPLSPYGSVVDFYRITMGQFTQQLHPGLPPTTLWGYADAANLGTSGTPNFRHLGGAIAARRGQPVRIKFSNQLPATHILPVDHSIPGAEAGAAQNRAVVHLHGGHVPWPSDGGPFHWFAPDGTVGPSVVKWLPDATGQMTDDYWYPNDQSARLIWYHDHAFGITRLNAYAGLASAYILTDAPEAALVASGVLPAADIPLVFQDKVFNEDGSLYYPDMYDTQFFDLGTGLPLPTPSCVPEFWGDTMLVNGTVAPFLEVEPRRYRFRLLNACNTRFLSLQVVHAAGTSFPDNTEPTKKVAVLMQQIATEGGFLDPARNPQGVVVGSKKEPLVLAPGERAEVIIDFSSLRPGDFLILHNDAPVPFPGGTPLGDFHVGNARLVTPPEAGFTPNTRTVLQFRVVRLNGPADVLPDPGWRLPDSDPEVPVVSPDCTVRHLTLNEAMDEYGRLSQLLGTNDVQPDGGFGRKYTDPETEVVGSGTKEIWNVYNLSADAHPIHFHLANVQILSRQAFNAKKFAGTPQFLGNPIPPDPNEMGWKETVRMNPAECTTLLMDFTLPADPDVNGQKVPVPESPRTGGYEYVWHCHILEHEEHDMMRPLVIKP